MTSRKNLFHLLLESYERVVCARECTRYFPRKLYPRAAVLINLVISMTRWKIENWIYYLGYYGNSERASYITIPP